jgi:hypothetical protein
MMVRLTPAIAVLVALASGCGFAGSGGRPEGVRFVTGNVDVADQDLVGRFNAGLQVAAVAIGDEPSDVKVFASAVFDPSRTESARFNALVDDEKSFVLVLQVPSASAGGPGALLAVLRFDDGRGAGTLLPAGGGDIDLGTLTVERAAAAIDSTLVVSDAQNPLAQIDTDADGSADLSDTDDDGDDVPDAMDPDVGGDGVDDVGQTLDALPDEDDDGTPDLLEG